MEHEDHVNLLKPANLNLGGTWADFGAGGGAFTLALRELISAEATIYAVDKDRARLDELQREYRMRFGDAQNLHVLVDDFSRRITLPPLDGVVMANSLHFFKDKEKVLRHVRTFLKPNGILLLVEYNAEKGNMWVPYPLTFEMFRALARQAGFSEPRLLAKHPSSFLREFYSALTSCK
ncbi:MAG TPA: class I SAM-dependent methyltransferase [Anaerolineales bacterium]